MGKMTEEALEALLHKAETNWSIHGARGLRAHIAAVTEQLKHLGGTVEVLTKENAALTAERDTLSEQLQTTHQQVGEVARLLDPEVCPDAWGLHAAAQKVLAERDEMQTEAHAAVSALLDLVKVLTDNEKEPAMDAARRVVAERDAYKRDLEAEFDGNKSLRKAFGARGDETFPMFVERIVLERDDLGTSLRQREKMYEEDVGRLIRERDEALKDAEMSDAAARANVAELDAIRERVKVLEASTATLTEHVRLADARLGDAGRVLGRVCVYATLGPDEAPGDVIDHAATEAVWRIVQEKNAAESRLAAIRQRAGDDSRLAEVLEQNVGKGGNAALRAVARYILGDEAPSEVDGRENEDAKWCAVCGEVGQHKMSCRPQNREDAARHAEPTTAEAFASIKREWGHGSPASERNLGYVSLLERRMGAQQRALEEVLKLHHRMPGDVISQIQAALTDASPVFTLEDVERAFGKASSKMRGDDTTADLLAEMLEFLTALRRKP